MSGKNKLAYYVYVENINKRKIEKYNVINDGIINEIKKRMKLQDIQTKIDSDKERFAGIVKQILMNHYWCRSEWEVIITDWPTHITVEEVERLNKEIENHKNEYSHEIQSVGVNLKTEEKIDVYDQVMMNWDIFIDYVWENLH